MPKPSRLAIPLRRRSFLLALLLLLPAGLLACQPRPARQAGSPEGGLKHSATGASPTEGEAPATVPVPEFPADCIDYLLSALDHPTEGYPALGASWQLVASLPGLDQSQSAAELRARIGAAVRAAGENPPPELIGAWLSTHPEPAARWLGDRLAAGGERYLAALVHCPQQRGLLGKLDLAAASEPAGAMILDLLRHWGRPDEDDKQVLKGLAARPEPGLSLRANGWLLALDKSDASALAALRSAIRDAGQAGGGPALAAAAEGARISGIAALAGDFVPWLTSTTMGEEKPDLAPRPQEAFASYAVSLLGGADGEAICRQLLKAQAPELRWKGRLGLLLAGKPGEWDSARADGEIEQRALWLALEPAEVMSPLLLPTYEAAAGSADQHIRGSAARQLARYVNIAPGSADYALVSSVLTRLSTDKETAVAAQAFRSAAGVQLGGLEAAARTLLASEAAAPELKLAACEYLLRRAAK